METKTGSSTVKPRSPALRLARWALLTCGGMLAAFVAGAVLLPTTRPPGHRVAQERADALERRRDQSLAALPLKSRVEPDELEGAIHAAAAYLVRATGDDGQFVYRVHLDPQAKIHPRYNMLRHAGSMFALANYQDRYPSPEVLDALRRQAGFLQREGIGPVNSDEEMLAVWSQPALTGAKAAPTCKLGGAGLALVALIGLEHVQPGVTDLADLRRLGNFVVWMQKPDGGFYSKFIPSEGGRSDVWTSLYYPGEAALGLVMLYEIDPSQDWLESAARCLALLARGRAGRDAVEADHWALLATERILPHCEKFQHIVSEDFLIRHARQICDSIISSRHAHPKLSPRIGSFMQDGRTCPTATRLEGLQAALTFLPQDDSPGTAQIENTVEQGVAFLLRTQIQDGPHAGGIPRAHSHLPDEPVLGDFNRRAGEIRIDYVQHALSAMLQFQQQHGHDE